MSYMKEMWGEFQEYLEREEAKPRMTWAEFEKRYDQACIAQGMSPCFAGQQAPVKWLKASMEEGIPSPLDDWGEDGFSSGTDDVPGTPEPKCEADKPEGTRDVEKFLKEQQDKLWRGE